MMTEVTDVKLSTVIVDDEPLARKLMKATLADFPQVEIVAVCKNGREAVKTVLQEEPDLLILDIQMPGMNGFSVIKHLQSEIVPMVIFCTAFESYAVDAFDLHAVDYLLKPVDPERLRRALDRAVQRYMSGEGGHNQKAPLLGAIDEIARRASAPADSATAPQPEETEAKIAIKERDTTVLIDTGDIDWVDAAGDYMCVHVNNEAHILRSTLKALMSKLDDTKFKRIHRSTIVNLERIVKVTSLQKGEYILDLDCDVQLKVSRNFRHAIKDFLTTM
jgi:two-component system LytT family response regulator